MTSLKKALTVTLIIIASLLVAWFAINTASTLTSINAKISELSDNVSKLYNRLESLEESITYTTVTKTVIATSPVTEIYEQVKDSVVLIRATSYYGTSLGSGFVYDKLGHIITNNHVIEGSYSITVTFLDGTSLAASVVGTDPYSDIAVLKVRPDVVTLKPLKLGNSSELMIGEQIVVVGSPFGLAGSVTTGIVSQKGRLLETTYGYSIPGVIQFDAAVNPGNSGGPLLNMKGEVVGITTAIESPISGFVGVGYAIPSTIIARVVPALIEKGSYVHSWIGITGTNMNEEIAGAMKVNVTKGVLITDVAPGSPADRAGLRGGDRVVRIGGQTIKIGGDIIIAINGIPIKTIEEILTYLEEKTSPGDVVVFSVLRGTEILQIRVVLGERPPPS
ncbi:MAG: trypsin-like peptidase domain-containing protein [Thaumarchaeota archaeon]|jgi:S1-C subfamily serine protease|nr:trypsin-like peptidase domain-containing protein [Candidatus Terraquivivens yellowstonensis]MCL7398470.1 trypsin-like peptidase domain-containing protein [Candidatus Terraquivivens yellowstonensis]MCL7400156.1 trypsin-like peptidase domain-containing protein [Candidatus Terraquivivens yellowstonensis]